MNKVWIMDGSRIICSFLFPKYKVGAFFYPFIKVRRTRMFFLLIRRSSQTSFRDRPPLKSAKIWRSLFVMGGVCSILSGINPYLRFEMLISLWRVLGHRSFSTTCQIHSPYSGGQFPQFLPSTPSPLLRYQLDDLRDNLPGPLVQLPFRQVGNGM